MALQKKFEGRYEVAGTHVYARAYQELDDGAVICVLEEGPKSPLRLESNRQAVTQEIARSMGRTPDQVRWYEQDARGQLLAYRAHPVDRGVKPPNDYSVGRPRRLTDEAVRSLEYHVGEKIETHAQQLRREFREQQRPERRTAPYLER